MYLAHREKITAEKENTRSSIASKIRVVFPPPASSLSISALALHILIGVIVSAAAADSRYVNVSRRRP